MRVKTKTDDEIVIERTEEAFQDTEYDFKTVDDDPNRIIFQKKQADDVTHKNILVLDQSGFTDVDRLRSPHDFEQAVVDFMRSSLKADAPNLEL